MIIELRVKNCYAFEDEITFSMKADMRNKKFGTNENGRNLWPKQCRENLSD